MKKNIILFAIIIVTLAGFAQDKITTTDNKELNVYIVEKTDRLIKYKISSFDRSPLFTTNLTNLKKIEYENGWVDLLGYQSRRMQKRFGISTGLSLFSSEGGMFTVSVDYFLNPNINLELNFGTDGYGTYNSYGVKYYFANKNSKSGLSPFVGLLHGREVGMNFFEFPIGINYITPFGLQATLQVSGLNHYNANSLTIHTELRLGWRF
ncbi:MAG: hypothetical protein Q7U47_11115 [Paludibacter sp.]|nr:hypothetical protein [Paludibacter sp.]